MIPRALLPWLSWKTRDAGEKRRDLGVSRVLKAGGSSARERWFSGSTALDFPVHSTVKAGRIVTSGSLCLFPLLGCLAFCSPSVGHDESAVDYDDETRAPGQR